MTELALDQIDTINNERYAERGYPHAEWTLLRREAPVWWNERHVTHPFWAVTRHEDIVRLSREPQRFRNSPRVAVFPKFGPPSPDKEPFRHLLHMDPPEHAAFRRLASPRFTPRGLGRMKEGIEAITSELLDEVAGDGGEQCADLVERFSGPLPLYVLAELLGVPRDMWSTLFRWTNETVGAADPEYRRAGESSAETAERARRSIFECFAELARERRARPRDDIISVLANARLGSSPLGELAFGIGEHFCLGANLARLELRVVFRHLLQRLDSIELDGPVARLGSSLIGGIKHMPVRCRVLPQRG